MLLAENADPSQVTSRGRMALDFAREADQETAGCYPWGSMGMGVGMDGGGD